MAEKIFRLANRLLEVKFSNDELSADVELFREGAWKHPAAPGGWFKVTKERIQEFINNFNRKVCGPEIPLEFSHVSDSATTPGWAVQFYEKLQNGISSLWAKLKFTDRAIAQRIKDGSLKWVSPTVVSDYEDTATGQRFEVIRSITLTNYPHIKNLHPMVVNFEEVLNEEDRYMKTAEEIRTQNDLLLRNIEDITLEDLQNGNIDVQFLSEEQIQDLADHFEMTAEQFAEKYPEAGKKGKMYGTRPKIAVPAEIKNLGAAEKKAFFVVFNQMYDKYKDVEKARNAALRKCKKSYGFKIEMEEDTSGGVKEFVEKFIAGLKKSVGLEDKPEEEPVEKIEMSEELKTKFEEQQREIAELRSFKQQAEFAEDSVLVESFIKMTPATKNILKTLLNTGRRSILEFEERQISVHDLVAMFLEEAKKSPSVNLFETKSIVEDESVDLEDEGKRRDARVQVLMKETPTLTYRQALDKVMFEEKNQGGAR